MRIAALFLLAVASCSQAPQDKVGPEPETHAPATVPPMTKAAMPAAEPAPPLIAGRYAPRDECAGLPGWKPFAAEIAAAVARRDVRAFAALASEDILLDFGGGAGTAELVKRLNDSAAPDFWQELEQVLALGCAKADSGAGASMPWFWEQNLGGEDPFEVWLVTGNAVALRSAADPGSKQRARLGWVLVRPVKDNVWKAPYQQVRVVGRSEEGFVAAKHLRSQVDYRLIAERIGGAWRITHLIAGD